MSQFQPAIKFLLLNEGGFSNDPNDPGGATNYGISLRYLRSLGAITANDLPSGDIDHDGTVDIKDILALTPEEAENIYQVYWWDKYNYGEIVDQSVATKTLDFGVNMGSAIGVKLLQLACHVLAPSVSIQIDGLIGPYTLEIVNSLDPQRLLTAYEYQAVNFYTNLAKNKASLQKYLKGWITRAYRDPRS